MTSSNERKEEQLNDIIEDFSYAMLTTKFTDRMLFHARPMRIVDYNEETNTIRFISGMDADKIDEIIRHPLAVITMQNGARCVSLSGYTSVKKDQALVEELWEPQMNIWFDGKDDPNIGVIEFRPEKGEYWDMASGSLVKSLVKEAKAFLTGEKPSWETPLNSKIDFKDQTRA